MNADILFLVISFIWGLAIAAALHILADRSVFWRDNFLSSTAAVCLASILSVTLPAYYCYNESDFVGDTDFISFIAPLFCSLIILAATYFNRIWITAVGVLAACSIGVILANVTIIFNPQWANWANTLATIGVYSIFSLGFYCIAGLTPLPQSQGVFSTAGLVIIAAFGYMPLSMGVSAAAILGVFLIAYIRGKIQPVNHNGAPLLGYIIGWLGLMSYNEYLLPCFVVFMMYYMVEAAVALLRKITTIAKYSDLPYNSVIYQAFESGAPVIAINRAIWYVGILLVILGVFQINSPNVYSFPVFACFVCLWQQYRLCNWNIPNKSLKENYTDTVNSIKETLSPLVGRGKKNKSDGE